MSQATATSGTGVVVTCGSCGTRLRMRESARGRKCKCPKCGTLLRFTDAPPPAPALAPAAAAATSPAPAAMPIAHSQVVQTEARPGGSMLTGTLAAMLVAACGVAAWWATERYAGRQLWVVKQAAAAWTIGMSIAAVMLLASKSRSGAARLTCAAFAALAIISAKLVLRDTFDIFDPLFVAMAIAGSACCFILSEPRD